LQSTIALLLILLCGHLNAYAETNLILIGGGQHPPEAIKKMAELVDASHTNRAIWVLPWGTDYTEEAVEEFKAEILPYGHTVVKAVLKVPIDPTEREALRAELLNELPRAGGVFFPGGDQNKIMESIRSLRLEKVLHDAYQSGVVFLGTSAGTAIQSNPMLSGVGSNHTEGLGLLDGFMIDQHFFKRNREPRLLAALSTLPKQLGLGIDEDMAVWIKDGTQFLALGPSKLRIYSKPLPDTQNRSWIDLYNNESMDCRSILNSI